MAVLRFNRFGGVVEKIAPDLLKESLSPSAVNARVDSGQLIPFKQNTLVTALQLGSPQSIYLYPGNNWFEWDNDVDVVKTPTAYDNTDTIIYTGDDFPKITRNDIALGAGRLPVAYYRLGVRAPTSHATVTETVASADPDALEELRYYVFTFVDAWGRESAPSPIGAPVLTKDGSTVRVTYPATTTYETENANFGAGALRRIYRTNTGTSSTEFQFVAETAYGTALFDDTVLNEALGEVLPTATWAHPPDDHASQEVNSYETLYPTGPLKGLVALPNGSLAGFTGNTLCFSEPYLPYAWPVSYRYPTNDDIVALVPISSGLVVLTEGRPVLAIGSDPSAIAMQQIDDNQACLSKRSAVDMGEFAVYAAPDGLMGISNGSVENLTAPLLTRDQWQAYNPSQLRAFRYEDMYLAFNDTSGFIFTPGGTVDSAFMPLDFSVDGGHYDPSSDVLYLLSGTNVYSFNTGAARTMRWKSGLIRTSEWTSFSVIRVKASAYPIRINITTNNGGTTVFVPDGSGTWLPPINGDEWSVEVDTDKAIHSVTLASSMSELTNG